jgi:pimeloyl-ACP methyl ester carboxylesterase
MIPLPGETGNDWWADTGSGEAMVANLRALGLPARADDDVLSFHDTPPDLLADIRTQPEPDQSMTPMSQPWPLAAWPSIPTWVLTGRDDRLFPADFQRRIARERLGLEPELLPGGHLLAWSHPEELAAKLVEIATNR